MRTALLAILLTGCGGVAEDARSNCGPASADYIEQSRAGCAIEDGGVFTLADGRVAPTLMVCTDPSGNVVESWCE